MKLFRILFLVLSCNLATAAVSEEELNGYDKLGPLEQQQGGSPLPMLGQVRNFVWDHWRQQRRGHVVFTVYTIEGEPTTSYLFIEPNKSGTWQIRGKLESIYSDRRMVDDPKKQPDRHVTRTFEAVRVIRIGRGANSSLALKTASGQLVDEF